MKNIKTLIKNNVVFFFIEFNLLLSIIGIFTGMTAARNNQYDNPLLLLLPVSNVLWIFFGLFAPMPQKNIETQEKIEDAVKFYALPPRRKATRIQEITIKFFINIIVAFSVLIVLSNFTMMLFLTLNTVIIPVFVSP